ncbi:Calx-beta domain-containing protein, partial [Maribacter sp. 2304DJ31-5]|uniref:Calx-beta domain-containing protein n=1 Tax=Maribacter sp. 2304DJ31-5 TaxID=3386273 RepID=UPI0039BC2CA7
MKLKSLDFTYNPTNFFISLFMLFGLFSYGQTISMGAGVSQSEGNAGATAFVFTVNRTGDVSGASSATYSVAGSGVSPSDATDFTGGVLPGGTVSFLATETSATITVNVNGDTDVEPAETFEVTLSAPSVGTTIGTATATGTINNDDNAISMGTGVSLSEGNAGATAFVFTVNRTGDVSGASSATYSVAGSGVSPSDATDFTGGVLPGGTVSFLGGEASTTITVNVNGDTDVESAETFEVTLSAPSAGSTIGTATATGTINNDDNAISMGTGVSLSEGNAGATAFVFTVNRTGDVSGASSATYSVAGSGVSPSDATDFTGGVLPGGTVSFLGGEASTTITV